MKIAEPMTLLTDYALAALGVWLGLRLVRLATATSDPRRAWGVTFLAMSAGALLGGTSHGFAHYFDAVTARVVWNLTLLAIGLASGWVLYATVRVLVAGRASRVLGWLIVVQVAFYGGWVWWVDNRFRTAVVQYGAAMAVVLVVHLVLAVRGRRGAWWIVAGLAVSFLAAGIQQAKIAPHPLFNHNDLYHVVQMLGLWWLYLGARWAAGR